MAAFTPALRSILLVSSVALSCTPTWAARNFMPQSGTWVVSSEVDGKPGRGLAIDVQGNAFFMQVFGYEKNGDATFHMATGQLDGDTITTALMRYTGGRSFGSPARDAAAEQSVGDVTVSFRNGLKGSVQFPGEPAVAIERFLVDSGEVSLVNPLAQLGYRNSLVLALDEGGSVAYDWAITMTRREDGVAMARLSQAYPMSTYLSYKPFQDFECHRIGSSAQLNCTAIPTQVDEWPDVKTPQVDAMRLWFAAEEVLGTVQLGGKKPVNLSLTGRTRGAYYSANNGRGGPNGQYRLRDSFEQSFQGASAPSESCMISCEKTTVYSTLMPYNGTWMVEDEITGKPGRGLALDIQGETAILQVFNYRADGQPTFHMGSAGYGTKGADSRASLAVIPLREYAGGKSMGGSTQPARAKAEAGDAQIEFSAAPPATETSWWDAGMIKLPGEAPVRIRRLQMDAPANFAERMLGEWYLPFIGKTLKLVRVDGDAVTTANGKERCTLSQGSQGTDLSCGQPQGNAWVWHQRLKIPTSYRDDGSMIRLRDRFGNAAGLGKLE